MQKLLLVILLCWAQGAIAETSAPLHWAREWPRTDFSQFAVDFDEIISGGPPKDGIPAIDDPQFAALSDIREIGADEPVLVLSQGSEVKAYPLRIMMWHEIVNDQIAEIPVTVTYCPLCNSAIVFDRRVKDEVLDFGVSGKLRHSDMVMYDRQTESWWQQFVGVGIVGAMTGVQLKQLPSRVIPFSRLQSEFPNARVLVAGQERYRRYGDNPYVRYDSAATPFLYQGDYDGPGEPLSYVVAVGDTAWLLADLRRVGEIEYAGLRLQWQKGMNSALDASTIRAGRDIGFVRVQRITAEGDEDVPYDTTFAFAFKAFHPDGQIRVIP